MKRNRLPCETKTEKKHWENMFCQV